MWASDWIALLSNRFFGLRVSCLSDVNVFAYAVRDFDQRLAFRNAEFCQASSVIRGQLQIYNIPIRKYTQRRPADL